LYGCIGLADISASTTARGSAVWVGRWFGADTSTITPPSSGGASRAPALPSGPVV
jgi:hypothetical protein